MAYRDFKYLNRRTATDKVLHDKVFVITKNPKNNGYQRGHTSMVYNFFDKKTAALIDKSTSGGTVKNETSSNEELAQELYKPIITKFEKRKIPSPFMDHIWGVDVAGMQLMSKLNKGFRFLLSVIDIYSKYE